MWTSKGAVRTNIQTNTDTESPDILQNYQISITIQCTSKLHPPLPKKNSQ